MSLMQDCPPPLIDSITVHHNSTGIHSNSHWLVFLTSVQQGRSLLRAQQHEYVLPCIAEMYQNLPKYSYLYIPDMQQWSPSAS